MGTESNNSSKKPTPSFPPKLPALKIPENLVESSFTSSPEPEENSAKKAAKSTLTKGVFILSIGIVIGLWLPKNSPTQVVEQAEVRLFNRPKNLSKVDLSKYLEAPNSNVGAWNPTFSFTQYGKDFKGIAKFTLNTELQERTQEYLKKFKPDYAAIAAIEVKTGKVLALSSYSKIDPEISNLALKATFPSASIFKIVTAAAAISEKNFSGDTSIAFMGRNHTLYRSQVFREVASRNRWLRQMSLREAFAKSVNTVFGKIGAQHLGFDRVGDFAQKFQFGKNIPFEVPLEKGRFESPEDPWALAEVASGFTRNTTMSPLQGAMIAASVANNGVMMEPYLVDEVTTPDGETIYRGAPKALSNIMSLSGSKEMRTLMKETVKSGTSRKSFRGFFKGRNELVEVGGKTGSLTGLEPPGKYDWFVGYMNSPNHEPIAVAVMTVHQEQWRVKSSYLARLIFEYQLAMDPIEKKRGPKIQPELNTPEPDENEADGEEAELQAAKPVPAIPPIAGVLVQPENL
jgi:penicillin-binding protein A